VPTPDGRTLDVYRAGSARDEVLLFHDGTPGAGIVSNQFLATVGEHDLQFVAFSRAGYGGSTRRPGRSVADVADDVGTVLDHIGATQCYEIGFSGGGPHCLATAALMPERVKAGAVVGSVAPFGAVGLEYLAGMGAENIEEFGAALAGSETLQAFLDGWLPSFVTVSGEQIADALGDLVPPVDRAALTGDFAESVAADIRQGLSGGIWGWHDDDLAFVRPWGFDLTTLRVPFALWQGEEDRMVPFAHGAWLAHHVPGVRAHLLPDHGHLSLAVASLGWILDDLLSSTSH
ncbi:MAG TPA: alpha/beta fold hydrolase, partial [Candidatus Limnocylindrales bacterium]|nr:alpha/beta fold hydrolase [Candidatus Limnocylindrales bacterium]